MQPNWPWHIGLRWAIFALWATCLTMLLQFILPTGMWHSLEKKISHFATWNTSFLRTRHWFNPQILDPVTCCFTLFLFVLRLNVPVNNFSVMSGRMFHILFIVSETVSHFHLYSLLHRNKLMSSFRTILSCDILNKGLISCLFYPEEGLISCLFYPEEGARPKHVYHNKMS